MIDPHTVSRLAQMKNEELVQSLVRDAQLRNGILTDESERWLIANAGTWQFRPWGRLQMLLRRAVAFVAGKPKPQPAIHLDQPLAEQ